MQIKFLFLSIFIFFNFLSLCAFIDTPECYNRIPAQFFERNVVSQALSLHYVTQSQWEVIITNLQRGARKIPQIIKEKANRLQRNPLEYPFQAEVATAMLKQELYDVFSKALYQSYVTNTEDIKGMFNYIERKQEHLFHSCLKGYTLTTP